MLNKRILFFSFVGLLQFLSAAVVADENQETMRQSMHCSIQSETQTVYPHSGKSKGAAYGILAGIGIGLATSGSSTFFTILAAGIGIGAAVDHVEYNDDLQQNYQHCLHKVTTQDVDTSPQPSDNPVPDFAKPISDVIPSAHAN